MSENDNFEIKLIFAFILLVVCLFAVAKWSIDKQVDNSMKYLIEIAKMEQNKCK